MFYIFQNHFRTSGLRGGGVRHGHVPLQRRLRLRPPAEDQVAEGRRADRLRDRAEVHPVLRSVADHHQDHRARFRHLHLLGGVRPGCGSSQCDAYRSGKDFDFSLGSLKPVTKSSNDYSNKGYVCLIFNFLMFSTSVSTFCLTFFFILTKQQTFLKVDYFVLFNIACLETKISICLQDVPNPPGLRWVECQAKDATVVWQPMGDNRAPILTYKIQYNTSFTPDTWETATGWNEGGAGYTGLSCQLRGGFGSKKKTTSFFKAYYSYSHWCFLSKIFLKSKIL